MKKIIRLTESDLTRIIKRVIKEQSSYVPKIGDKISGIANAGGNRPIDIEFKITSKDVSGYKGVLTSWGYDPSYGTKVGDSVLLKKINGNLKGRDNATCVITLPKNSKMGEIELEYCELI